MFGFSQEVSGQALARALQEAADRGAASAQVLVATDDPGVLEDLSRAVCEASVPAFGGIFPGLILEGAVHREGLLVLDHAPLEALFVLPLASTGAPERDDAVSGPSRILEPGSALLPLSTLDADRLRTVFVYLDATADGRVVMDALFDELGLQRSFLGGGAGFLDFQRRPVVIAPDGLHANAVVVAATAERSEVSVRHGWTAMSEAIFVSAADGNLLQGLNWRPAFETYREIVEAHAGRTFADSSFHELASSYPLILERIGAEGTIRDPLLVHDDGALQLAGSVPAHATMRVAVGDRDSMFAAATEAREALEDTARTGDLRRSIVIDCISRALLLGEDIREELQCLRFEGLPQVGALTIGEVAHLGNEYLQFHNKTCVLSLVE